MYLKVKLLLSGLFFLLSTSAHNFKNVFIAYKTFLKQDNDYALTGGDDSDVNCCSFYNNPSIIISFLTTGPSTPLEIPDVLSVCVRVCERGRVIHTIITVTSEVRGKGK